MKLLILDETTEAQAICASRIESFNQSDMEMLDLQVHLVSENDYSDKLEQTDVLIIGSQVGERGVYIARQVNSSFPWIHVIMFVTDEAYGGGAFRSAHSVGVRKVFADGADSLDLLQELVAINAEFKKEGRTREGRLTVLIHAKGGVGATSVAAALAEVSSLANTKSLLWDLDVETRDLSRALRVNGSEAKLVSAWVNGTRDITRQSLSDAIIEFNDSVSLLMPPDRMAESMDLVCHTDGIGLIQRISELGKILFDNVIVDTGGRMGPAIGSLLRDADNVIIVMDDSVLGLTAVDVYLSFIKSLVGDVNRIKFLVNSYTGSLLNIEQIAAEIQQFHDISMESWLTPIPSDLKASSWPGTGKTIYSLGNRSTRSALEKLAAETKLIDVQGAVPTKENKSLFGKLFGKKDKNVQDSTIKSLGYDNKEEK